MQTAQPESDKEEQPLPQPENEKVTAEPETPQKEEEQQPHSSDILEAYQEMKARLEESTCTIHILESLQKQTVVSIFTNHVRCN